MLINQKGNELMGIFEWHLKTFNSMETVWCEAKTDVQLENRYSRSSLHLFVHNFFSEKLKKKLISGEFNEQWEATTKVQM